MGTTNIVRNCVQIIPCYLDGKSAPHHGIFNKYDMIMNQIRDIWFKISALRYLHGLNLICYQEILLADLHFLTWIY